MQLKNLATLVSGALLIGSPLVAGLFHSCSNPALSSKVTDEVPKDKDRSQLAVQNLQRSIDLLDRTMEVYFEPQTLKMSRFYNPSTQEKSEEVASVWMYTAGIEAVNAILHGLENLNNSGESALYQAHYDRLVDLLDNFYRQADYYLGSFELTSYTQTKTWSVYAVNRAANKGEADVSGVLNVYDDQMWLIRELLDSYALTGKQGYLEKAEYLTDYVLDGWDVTRKQDGKENGGIPWGPGYTTKHACSNGPLISSLVWLHEIYKNQPEEITHRYIDSDDLETRRQEQVEKQDYYLNYAEAVYQWQKSNLLNQQGVYTDMMGGCVPNCDIQYQEIDGVRYRANTPLTEAVGEAYTYNSGTMLSGAADLHRATGQDQYREDALQLSESSFRHFAVLGQEVPQHYSFESDGFRNWFNGILLRGYHDIADLDPQASAYMQAFQANLDYAFEHHLQEGLLPSNLLVGWGDDQQDQNVEGMFMFTYAAQYAVLAQQQADAAF